MGLDSSCNDVGNEFKFYTHYCKVKLDVIDQMIEENLPLYQSDECFVEINIYCPNNNIAKDDSHVYDYA